MTEEERNQLIADGKLDAEGNPIEPSNNGGEPVKHPEGSKKVELTQEQLDAIVEGRLARDRAAREKAEAEKAAEDERKRLAENNEFKTLAEKYEAELAQLKESARQADLNSKRTSELLKAGYNEEQVTRYVKYVEGETAEEIKAAVELLKKDVPPTPKYVDPNAGNSSRQKPVPKDKEEKGRSYFQRLKDEGKIRK